MIKGLAHTCFVVKDLDASIDFYCNKLGLTPAFDFVSEQGKRFGIYIHVGGRCFIELFIGEPRPVEKASYQHLCLEVEGFDETVVTLQKRGVAVTGVCLGSDESYQAWIADPDGNVIELHGYTPKSKQGPWLK